MKTELLRFMDDDQRGRWANIRMTNGDPCWIGIAQSGILVKKSRIGLFGAKIYDEKDLPKAAAMAQFLEELFDEDLTPPEMWNPVLVAFVNAVLRCDDLASAAVILNPPTL